MKKTTVLELAEMWLRNRLQNGEVLSSVIFVESGGEGGFSRAVMYRAADRIGVVSKPGPTHRSRVWELPQPKPFVVERASDTAKRLGLFRPDVDL